MLDPIFLFARELFQCTGLFFILIFAWRTMVGATGPHLSSSLLKPMWRFGVKSFRWLLKHTWKLSGQVAKALEKQTPAKYRPYVEPTVRAVICLVIVLAVLAFLHF
jgi:hypothetical protein